MRYAAGGGVAHGNALHFPLVHPCLLVGGAQGNCVVEITIGNACNCVLASLFVTTFEVCEKGGNFQNSPLASIDRDNHIFRIVSCACHDKRPRHVAQNRHAAIGNANANDAQPKGHVEEIQASHTKPKVETKHPYRVLYDNGHEMHHGTPGAVKGRPDVFIGVVVFPANELGFDVILPAILVILPTDTPLAVVGLDLVCSRRT
jgi:hypothetical protein